MEDPASGSLSSTPQNDLNQGSPPSVSVTEPPVIPPSEPVDFPTQEKNPPPPPMPESPPLTESSLHPLPDEVPVAAEEKVESPLAPNQLEEAPPLVVPSSTEPPLVFRNPNEGGNKPRKPYLVGGAILMFLAISSALAFYFFQKGGFGIQKKAAEGDQCNYGQNCTTSNGSSGTQSCTGKIQDGSCKYSSSVAPNCSSCTSCGDGVCGGGEGADNCPADCGGGGGGNCTPVKTYSGGSACSKGDNASVTVTACIPDGCPLTGASVTYGQVIAYCDNTNCDGACGGSPANQTLTIPAGTKCASATASCSPRNGCGTCQVDIDNNGNRKWQDSGCSAPTAKTCNSQCSSQAECQQINPNYICQGLTFGPVGYCRNNSCPAETSCTCPAGGTKKCFESCNSSSECSTGLTCGADWCAPGKICSQINKCYNPSCPTDPACSCQTPTNTPTPTPTPTNTPTATPIPTATPTRSPSCVEPVRITLESAGEGSTRIIASSTYGYTNVGIRVTSGGTETPYKDPAIQGSFNWIWTIPKSLSSITSVTFYTDIDLGKNAVACGTWTPPTPTPTTPLLACSDVQVSITEGGDLNNLKIGDSLSFLVTFNGTVEDVGIVIKKEGIRVKTLTAGSQRANSWTSPAYTIESLGSYEILGYIKTNGTWK